MYLHVLASSLLISVLGLGAMHAVRIQMRSCRLMRDSAEARSCATSAVELGMLHIKTDTAWRTTWPNGTWMEDQPLGSGTFTLQGTDPQTTTWPTRRMMRSSSPASAPAGRPAIWHKWCLRRSSSPLRR